MQTQKMSHSQPLSRKINAWVCENAEYNLYENCIIMLQVMHKFMVPVV